MKLIYWYEAMMLSYLYKKNIDMKALIVRKIDKVVNYTEDCKPKVDTFTRIYFCGIPVYKSFFSKDISLSY